MPARGLAGICLVGGKLAVVSDSGAMSVVGVSHANSSPAALQAAMVHLVASSSPQPSGLGIALDATLDHARRTVLSMPPYPSWNDYGLAATLEPHVGCPVTLCTLAEAGALAWQSAHPSSETRGSALYLLVAREVTATLLRDGKLADTHAEPALDEAVRAVGHLPVCKDGPRCGCGNLGHLNVVSSAQAIVRRYIGLAAASDAATETMLKAAHGRAEAISAHKVVQLAHEGDEAARSAVEPAVAGIAMAIVHLEALASFQRIIIAGPLAPAADAFLQLLENVLPRDTMDRLSLAPWHITDGARGAIECFR